MKNKITLSCYFIIIALLLTGCQNKSENIKNVENKVMEEVQVNAFDDTYRPNWWENIENKEFIHSYAFADGSEQDTIKVEAITSAHKKLLHYKKDYVVNLTELILKESDSKGKFKARSIMARNSLIYKKDFSPFLKIVKTDFQAIDEKQSRCFVAVGIPLEVIQKEYVRQFQKQKDMASVFAKSETYRYLLKLSGVEAIPAQSKPKKESIKKQESKKNKVTGHKYDADITPAWFNISYNNKKVMVNQTATAESEKESLAQAIANCNKAKMKIADNFVRTEIEKYRKLSQYDEIKFAKIKNKASKEVSQLNYPITKEFVKTIQLGKNSYKSYVQYSLNKKSLQSTLIKVLKEDEVLYSRLRASMSFDELEDDDF